MQHLLTSVSLHCCKQLSKVRFCAERRRCLQPPERTAETFKLIETKMSDGEGKQLYYQNIPQQNVIFTRMAFHIHAQDRRSAKISITWMVEAGLQSMFKDDIPV